MDEQYTIRQLREERERRESLWSEIQTLQARQQAEPENHGIAERISNLSRAAARSNDTVNELESQLERYSVLERAASDYSAREDGVDLGGDSTDRYGVGPQERRGFAFDEAQRQMESLLRSAQLSSAAVDRLDHHLRDNDPAGCDAQYLAAVSQPEYATGFGKVMAHGEQAILRMSDEERSAVEQVFLAEKQRTMVEGTNTAGGFALPITVDPTLNLMSDGAINPIRQLATVRTISTREFRQLTTDGIVAAYAAEMTEASDNSPVLAMPDAFVERFQAFVPVSIELLGDWSSLAPQLAQLFSDAKDVMEAQAFLNGGGHGATPPQPAGIVGGVTGSLTTSQKVATAGAASVSTHDIYALRAAIPPRFLGNASVTVSPAIQDVLWNLVPRASTTDNVLVPDREHILEMPLKPWSTMAAALTTGSIIAIAGDFKRGYCCIDRLGLTIETVPHIFGGSGRPVGARGFYMFGRNTGIVLASSDKAPLRYLQTT